MDASGCHRTLSLRYNVLKVISSRAVGQPYEWWFKVQKGLYIWDFYLAQLHDEIEQILTEILHLSELEHYFKMKVREFSSKSEFHHSWSHFTMHHLLLTVLTYKAFSLQYNTWIIFREDIFYLWILFRWKHGLLIQASNTTHGNSNLHQVKQKWLKLSEKCCKSFFEPWSLLWIIWGKGSNV